MARIGEIGFLRVKVGAAFLTGMTLVLVLTQSWGGSRATVKRAVPAAGAEARLSPAPMSIHPVTGGAARVFPDSIPSLDRIAAAVDAAESNYGTNPRMKRADPDGPQGPMQLTAAAAADVGGGDRLDPSENRALGRAYLARMYRRYGRWADAIAAYNWGPRHMDAWIHQGRRGDRLPAAVARYTGWVLLAAASPGVQLPDPNVPALSLTGHRPDSSPRPRQASRHEGVAGADGPFIPAGAGGIGTTPLTLMLHSHGRQGSKKGATGRSHASSSRASETQARALFSAKASGSNRNDSSSGIRRALHHRTAANERSRLIPPRSSRAQETRPRGRATHLAPNLISSGTGKARTRTAPSRRLALHLRGRSIYSTVHTGS
jgi:hypothetical protein